MKRENFNQNIRLSIDIGGTFTDAVLEINGIPHTAKLPTDTENPEQGFLDISFLLLKQTGKLASEVTSIIHGTTLATNALVERRGAKTALITTKGFRDCLEIGYESRHDQYDLHLKKLKPLVPRYLRLPVSERTLSNKQIDTKLEPESVLALIPVLQKHEVASIAIGFLHSHVNSCNEEIAEKLFRQYLPNIPISLSAHVCPEIREYERFSTTVADAYIKPLMGNYIRSLENKLLENNFSCSVFLVTSSGGLTSLEDAANRPIQLVESGPSGGAMLAEEVARESNENKVLSYDMGGTTAKICLINEFESATAREFEAARGERFTKGSGMPLRIPVKEMIEIGAGGGSIASLDSMNRSQVGPRSAGSIPGPACYGKGGSEATVTDADAVLGRLDPEEFAEGRMRLDIQASEVALMNYGAALDTPMMGNDQGQRHVANTQIAHAISEIVDENMANAARIHAIEHASDLRDYTLVAFGGAGPLHAASLAGKLNISKIIIPVSPGVGSAMGFLSMPVSCDLTRSQYMILNKLDVFEIQEIFKELEQQALARVTLASPASKFRIHRTVLMRYVGQGHEIQVTIPRGTKLSEIEGTLKRAYDTEYSLLYGRLLTSSEIEILTFAVKVHSKSKCKDEANERLLNPSCQEVEPIKFKPTFDFHLNQWVSTPVYKRELLAPGFNTLGPALILEPQTTTVVPANFELEVDALGKLVLTRFVETNDSKNRDKSLEDINLQVMWNRLQGIVDELAAVLMRTAFSPIVRESGDLSVGYFNLQGEMLAQAITGTPGHVNTMASACKKFFRHFPPESMHPEDIYLTNDPWQGAGHLNDFVLLKPYFFNEELMGFISCTSHLVDIGGRCLGPDGNDVFDEGLYIPHLKLVDEGALNETLITLLRSNSRNPEQAEGDVYALIACCGRGVTRLNEMIAYFGSQLMCKLSNRILKSSEAAVRSRINNIENGSWKYEMTVDGYEIPITLKAKLEIDESKLKLDFYESSDPSPHGINVPLNYTIAYSVFGLKCAIAPDIPNNHGSLLPFEVVAERNSILNANKPQPVCSRHILGQLLPDVALGCLSEVLSNETPAEGASTLWDIPISGYFTDTGQSFSQELVFNGGTGARSSGDGLSATAFPSGVLGSLVEVTETTTPIIIRQREMRSGSGGKGRYRGGHGQVIVIEALANTRLKIFGTVDRVKYPARGKAGGCAGLTGRFIHSGGTIFEGKGFCELNPGESIEIRTPGGGGWGEAVERSSEAIFEEQRDELD